MLLATSTRRPGTLPNLQRTAHAWKFRITQPQMSVVLKLRNPALWSTFLAETTAWFPSPLWTVTDAEVEKETQADRLTQTLVSFIARLLS